MSPATASLARSALAARSDDRRLYSQAILSTTSSYTVDARRSLKLRPSQILGYLFVS